MNKRGWTREQIFELVENLYKHHEDYGQGRIQDFHTVCVNCKYAAEIITQLFDSYADREREKLMAELDNRANKAERDNKVLKECIVRMALGRYGVLND